MQYTLNSDKKLNNPIVCIWPAVCRHTLADETDEEFSTIGIAYVAGVCDDYYRVSLSVYIADGYNTLYILAHELGHRYARSLQKSTFSLYLCRCPTLTNEIVSTGSLAVSVIIILHTWNCIAILFALNL